MLRVSPLGTFVLYSPSDGRRRNMAAIRSKDTKPERIVRSMVHRAGYRYRLHEQRLPGRPDLVFPRFRLVAFVHGCFWHGHECSVGQRPRSNTGYWGPKIDRTISRDQQSSRALRGAGWRVSIIRECTFDRDVNRLLSRLGRLRECEGV